MELYQEDIRKRQKKRAPKAPGDHNFNQEEILHMVSTFAVLRFIQTFAFLLFRHAQADGEIDDLKGDIRYDSGPYNRGQHRSQLNHELA